MADTKDDRLTNIVQKDSNFAIICSFLTNYGTLLGLSDVSFDQLEKWIDDTRYVNDSLKDLLMKLLKRWKHSVKEDRMHQYLVRFCHTYSDLDAWELESLGFQRCKSTTKLRVLKNLLECQFDHNVKFKEKINMIPSDELRCLPIGRDFMGKAYWFQMDNDLNMRIYSEEQDDVHNETWQVVVTDRAELASLIALLQEQRSRPEEKSRSATPSTIESDVASVEVCGLGTLHEASVSEASSDEVPLCALKADADITLQLEDFSNCSGEAKDDDKKFANLAVKVEPTDSDNENCRTTTENGALESRVKIESGSLADKAEITELKTKDEELDSEKASQFTVASAESGAELTHLSRIATASELESDLTLSADRVETVCSKTDADGAIEDDGCNKGAVSSCIDDNNQTGDCNTDNTVSNTASETECQTLSCENKSHSNSTTSSASDCGNQDQGVDSMTETTVTSHSECSSQKLKKPVSKQGNETPPGSPAQKMSVKRKRISLCRIPSSSSEDATAAPVTESDLSDSISADSHSLSGGEEEPPTKRKRDKALKTAAERNRKSGRMKTTVTALSPKSSTIHKLQGEETALALDIDNAASDNSAEKYSIPDGADNSVVNSCSGTEKADKHLDKPSSPKSMNEHTQESSVTVVSVSEDLFSCLAEQTATFATEKTADCESALSTQQDSLEVADSSEVAGKKVCNDADTAAVLDSKSLEDEASEKKEGTGDKQSSCSAKATDMVPVCSSSESSVQIADNIVLNGYCSEDKRVNDELSADMENHQKKDDACKSHDGTHDTDVAEASAQSGTCEDENKLQDKLASNGHTVGAAKKMRGRPKKANKKGRKKREHSNVGSIASVTEVQETDYEPTKKLGRPSKKSRLAQLAAEACDSLPQSEDDIPLIALQQAAEDDIPLIELRRSSRANKGQRKLDQLVLQQPKKKRNRAKDEEKERKQAEKEEKRQKREAELQEQAALKAKKKKRGKSDSDDDFVPGKKSLSWPVKGRGSKKTPKTPAYCDSVSSDATDELYALLEPESEDEAGTSSSSLSDHLDSDGSEYVPRGRNAKRAAALKEKRGEKEDDTEVEDKPCTRCGKSNQPEWILLCDRCDAGYHTACLRPPIMLIPEDDWFCPLCEHSLLIEKLQEQLSEFDKKAKLNVRLIQRKERLAYVTVNLSNIIEHGDRRAVSNPFADTDLYDDDASEEEESSQPASTSRSTLRKQASHRRSRHSSVSSSLISSDDEQEEEELSEVESRFGKRKERSRLASDSEENSWLYGRRSCRQRKQISYKFEEFDQLITGAIEDDIKEPDSDPKPPRRLGKDMSNITGLSDLADDKPSTGKQKKRTRHLTTLDSEESEDDSEEFQLSDADEASTADDDADNVDDELSDDWSVTRASSWTTSRATRKSSRRRQRSSRMNNFVGDDSDEEDDRSYQRTRRAAARQQVNYHEISNSDTAASDSDHSTAAPRRNTTAAKSAKPSRRMKDSDSDYQPSSAAEDAVSAVVLSSQIAGRCKRLGSGSDQSGSEAISKKKGRINRIMSSSDYSTSDDDENSNTQAVDDKSAAVNGECQELPVVNGQHQQDRDTIESNSVSENNKGFTIASLLRTSDRTAISDNDSESSEQNDFSEEDSLSGIEDLVNYVTQS